MGNGDEFPGPVLASHVVQHEVHRAAQASTQVFRSPHLLTADRLRTSAYLSAVPPELW